MPAGRTGQCLSNNVFTAALVVSIGCGLDAEAPPASAAISNFDNSPRTDFANRHPKWKQQRQNLAARDALQPANLGRPAILRCVCK
jgi:hypothetical protein